MILKIIVLFSGRIKTPSIENLSSCSTPSSKSSTSGEFLVPNDEDQIITMDKINCLTKTESDREIEEVTT